MSDQHSNAQPAEGGATPPTAPDLPTAPPVPPAPAEAAQASAAPTPDAPAYAAPAYSAPAYAAAPVTGQAGYEQAPGTNVLSIISLIASIVGFVWLLPLIGSLAGAIMGHIALGQIKRSGDKGRGLAIAGVVVGWVGFGLAVLGLILFFSFFAWVFSQSSDVSFT